MCGFMGVISPHSHHHKNFKDTANTIAVRGSQPLSVHQTKAQSLAYARLPTDDLANTALSKLSGGGPQLLFNGLLTNVAELCQEFSLVEDAVASDHVCMREGLIINEISFLSACRGMFAGALITDTSVLLFRDTIGIKPLYYVHHNDLFAFASEMKALQGFEHIVHELTPGSTVQFNKKTERITKRAFNYTPKVKQPLEQLLRQAVVAPTQRYLSQTPDKKVALLLSGGVDSSLIAGLLVKYLPHELRQRLIAFSLGSPASRDVIIGGRLAAELGIRHVHVPLPSDYVMVKGLKGAVNRTESPHARVVKVGLLYAELATAIKKQSIDVVIGGEGADELFFGYHRFIDDLTHRQAEQLFNDFFKDVFPHTLLQRFDRIFAGNQIEARVPFLDQAVIAYAQQLSPEAKIAYTRDGHVSKLPLRQLAKEIGLPAYIYERGKEKMTSGATGKQNTGGRDGYLEQAAIDLYETSFQDIVFDYYAMYFPQIIQREYHLTEAALAEETRLYKRINAIKKRGVYASK